MQTATKTDQQLKEAVKSLSEQRTKCEVWTRVMGYHRPVSQFNRGKKSEHAERTHFCEGKSFASTFGAETA